MGLKMIEITSTGIKGSCKAKDFKKEIEALKDLMRAEQ